MAASNQYSHILSALQIEKEAFWLEHCHLTPQETQLQWSVKIAPFTSVLGSGAPTRRLGLDVDTSDPPEGQHVLVPSPAIPSSDNPIRSNLDRQQSLSQHSTPMSRKRSSDSRYGPSHLAGMDGAIPPLTINDYQLNEDEPFSNYTVDKPHKVRRTSSGRHPLQIPEVAVYEDPKDFYSKFESGPTGLSPTVPSHTRSRRGSHRVSLSSEPAAICPPFSTISGSPSTAATDGLTHTSMFTSGNMSRQSSHTGSSVCRGFDMLHLNSQRSDITSDLSMNFENSPLDLGDQSLAPSNECIMSQFDGDMSHFIGHAGGMIDRSIHSLSSSVPLPPTTALQSSIDDETGMKRSSSTETNNSQCSRVSRRSQEQLAQSSRPLAPKLDSAPFMSRHSSSSEHHMVRITSADGSTKEVVSIPKALYVRPTHEKVKCSQCEEQPDGFRGEHELRRHIERAHSTSRKAFVCVDISPNKEFLSKCKACRSNKKYHAYYNAAAHLRRAHFNPKPKGRKGKAKPEERRGGKGGGDSPSMDILKMWMKEFEEFVPENVPMYDDEREDGDFMSGVISNLFEEQDAQPCRSNVGTEQDLQPSSISTPIINIPEPTRYAATPTLFSARASVQSQAYDSTRIQLSHSRWPFAADDNTSLLDLSQDTSLNDPNGLNIANDFDDGVFNISQYFNNPQFFDGLVVNDVSALP